MQVLYFAWVRERIGVPREEVETAAETVPIWWRNYVAARKDMTLPFPI